MGRLAKKLAAGRYVSGYTSPLPPERIRHD
jgi:hypothetical protein